MSDIAAATPNDMCKLWGAILYAANEKGPASQENMSTLLDLLAEIGEPAHVAQVMTRLAGSLLRQLAYDHRDTPDSIVSGIISAYSDIEGKTEGR